MKLSKELMDAVRELVGMIGEDEVQEIEIEHGSWGQGKIRVVRKGITVVQASPQVGPVAASPPVASEPAASKAPEPVPEDDGRYYTLKSPMVGMFYRAPNPDAPPYIQEGDVVSEGQTICIIEAMKIMNEIEADVKGRVVRVLAENATPVEYNTPLLLIDPQG